MLENRNSDTISEIRAALALQTSTDKIPNPIPVVEVNPKMLRRVNYIDSQAATNAASTGFTALPNRKRLFLTSAVLSYVKDGTSTATSCALQVQLKGGASNSNLIVLPSLSATAQSDTLQCVFNPPVELEEASTPRIIGSASANMTVRGQIHGFLVDIND